MFMAGRVPGFLLPLSGTSPKDRQPWRMGLEEDWKMQGKQSEQTTTTTTKSNT